MQDREDRKCWFNSDGQLDREDGPAVLWNDGVEVWMSKDKIHRDGGPAVTRLNGDRVWFRHGRRHRKDGPAEIKGNGHREWIVDGQLINVDGPTCEFKLDKLVLLGLCLELKSQLNVPKNSLNQSFGTLNQSFGTFNSFLIKELFDPRLLMLIWIFCECE